MKNINKFFVVLIAIGMMAISSCDVDADIAKEVDPTSYPVVTITPSADSGITVNEEGSPAFTFDIHMDGMLDRPVVFSAKQVGGDASTSDYTFASAVIQPYSTDATFTLSILEDGITEDTETLQLQIGAFDVGSMYLISPNSDVIDFTVNIENCADCVTCDWTLDMQDAYGDGWNGASLTFDVEGTLSEYTLEDGSSGQHIIAITDQSNFTVTYAAGSWESEVTYQLYDPNGNLVLDEGPYPNTGEVYSGFNDCQ